MEEPRLHGRNGLGRAFGRKWKLWRLLLAITVVAAGSIFVHRSLFVGKYKVIAEGKLYRSRQPSGLQYSVLLQRQDFTRIINLRFPGEDPQAFVEEKNFCRREDIEFISMPIPAQGPTRSQVKQFLRLIDTSPGPVLVHCEHGRNRTGIMCAIYRIARQGVPVEQALREELAAYNIRRVTTNREAIIEMLQQFVSISPQPDNQPEVLRKDPYDKSRNAIAVPR